jgi:hypothetical protein
MNDWRIDANWSRNLTKSYQEKMDVVKISLGDLNRLFERERKRKRVCESKYWAPHFHQSNQDLGIIIFRETCCSRRCALVRTWWAANMFSRWVSVFGWKGRQTSMRSCVCRRWSWSWCWGRSWSSWLIGWRQRQLILMAVSTRLVHAWPNKLVPYVLPGVSGSLKGNVWTGRLIIKGCEQ